MNIAQSPSSDNETLWESRFSKIYQSEAWQSLDPLDRAQLLLVAEWKKPWTIIWWDQTNFLAILAQLWLEYSLDESKRNLFPAFIVWNNHDLWEYFKKRLQLTRRWYWSAYDYLTGSFLGYPECCTEEYCHPSLNIVKRRLFSPNTFIPNFTYESIENWWYPDEFNYCPPSFTPCSIHCKEAIKVLKVWKLLLEKYDSTWAQELREFNKRGNAEEVISFDGLSIPWKVKRILSNWN